MTAGDLELSFSTEPLIGWRVWRVCREIDGLRSAHDLALRLLDAERRGEERPVAQLFRYRLRSLTELGFWPPRARLEAACRRAGAGHGAAPLAACECGVWAFSGAERAAAEAEAYAHGSTAVAVGSVWLWGRVVEHEDGWRAQYAYPRALTVHGGDPAAADDVRDLYGIDAGFSHRPALRAA